MTDNAAVVVFPSVFSQNKVNLLISNIKKILNLHNQQFQKIRKDDSIIIIDANDPVFASSTVNLLFGIERIAIAKQVKNEFKELVSSITKLGTNLLLKGDKFYVKVEGHSFGYLPKDVEMATTSSLIEKAGKIGAKPGTEDKFDKLLYTYVTKSNAYVCIFTDKGLGGIPYNSHNERVVCCIYDELSAVACLETIKEGYDVKIIVCYFKESDLLNLVKIVSNLLPRTISQKVNLEFFRLEQSNTNAKNFLFNIGVITELLLSVANSNKIKKISFGISPLIFSSQFVDTIITRVFQNKKIPIIPLSGLDNDIFVSAKEIGLGKHLSKIERLGKMNLKQVQYNQKDVKDVAQKVIKTKKSIAVDVGLNNVHDILDSLKEKH